MYVSFFFGVFSVRFFLLFVLFLIEYTTILPGTPNNFIIRLVPIYSRHKFIHSKLHERMDESEREKEKRRLGTRYGTFFVMVGFLLSGCGCICNIHKHIHTVHRYTFYENTTAALLFCSGFFFCLCVVTMRSICLYFPILFSDFQLSKYSANKNPSHNASNEWTRREKKKNVFVYYLFVICMELHI